MPQGPNAARKGCTGRRITSSTTRTRRRTCLRSTSSGRRTTATRERRAVRVHGGAVHREVVREGGKGRPGEVHRRDGGMALDSPVGKLEMRACDHQLLLPVFFGVTRSRPSTSSSSRGRRVRPPKEFMPGVTRSRRRGRSKPSADGPAGEPRLLRCSVPDPGGAQPDDDPVHRLVRPDPHLGGLADPEHRARLPVHGRRLRGVHGVSVPRGRMPPLGALAVAPLAVAALGFVLERGFFSYLYDGST